MSIAAILFIVAFILAVVFLAIRRGPWEVYVCILLICIGLLVNSFIRT